MKLFYQNPAPDLYNLVKSFWMLEVPEAYSNQRITIIADIYPELMFQVGQVSTSSFSSTNQEFQYLQCVMGGYQGHALLQFKGAVKLIFVKLQPWALRSCFGLSPSEFSNTQVDFAEIGHLKLMGRAELLAEGSYLKWKEEIEFFLRHRLARRKPDPILIEVVKLIELSNGQIAVRNLVDKIPVGERRLEQLFKDEIGISPKRFARTVRIRSACKAMERGKFNSLTHLAYQSGFSDQAHFIRDFRGYMNMSPRTYLSQIETKEGIKLVMPDISDSYNFPQ